MDDFLQQVEKIKSDLSDTIKIASGEIVDAIDPTKLITDAMELANKCFTGGVMSGAQMIARKDAYDFTTAVARSADMFSADRSRYYAEAVKELEIVTNRVEFNKAAVLHYEAHGNAE